MTTKSTPVHWLFLSILLTFGFSSQAQFVEIAPVPSRTHFNSKSSPFASARIQNTNQIPFWDDFSTGIDTLKWIVNGVSYTETVGLNAPSIGMILFDGADSKGKPYSSTVQDQGESDFLTSKPFDLGQIPTNQKETLYLSFFWQAGGRGEIPDENDQLILQIFSQEKTWTTIWTQQGGEANLSEEFKEENIKILPEWQHENFQFRFLSDGRKSGPFDSWLLDYVYFNTERTATTRGYPDRTLTQKNHLRLGEFGAYPQELLIKNPSLKWSLIENEFLNLENRFRAMEYSIQIKESKSGKTQAINTNTPFNPVPNAKERRSFKSRELTDFQTPSEQTRLEIKTFLTSGDKPLSSIISGDTLVYPQVNFAQNDTVTTSFPLLDYFAYDNGSTDYAAGINQRTGMVALKYESPEDVYIKGISINFTNRNQIDLPIDIMIWNDLTKKPIFSKEELIAFPSQLDEYMYIPLDTNIRVKGEFYVGYTQFTNDFVHVGLDKTTDHGDKIYYNVKGAWEQNKEVLGALMIRPHVSLTMPFAASEIPSSILKIYPNPSQGTVNVEGNFSQLRIFDSFGREIFPDREITTKGELINFIGKKPGIYLLNLVTAAGPESFRILVN